MARRVVDPETLEAEIARLPDLGLVELRARWKELYGRPAPKFFRRKLLVRGVAYQMQVEVYGGLSPETKRLLRGIAEAVRQGTFDAAAVVAPRIKPGTKLVRSWKDNVHTVLALEDGFEWKGARYRSLSTIAKLITGTNWNGWTFFGLKASAPKEGRDVLGRFRKPAAGPDGKAVWPRSRSRASVRRPMDRANA
jgi:DUF2924 family protein